MKRNRQLTVIGLSMLFISAIMLAPHSIVAQASEGITSVAWSPDGSKVAGAGTNGLLRIWDVTTNQLLFDLTVLPYNLHSIIWSPDSTKVACASENGLIRIWDITSGELAAEIDTVAMQRDTLGGIAWSPDGTTLAAVIAGETDPIFMWHLDNGTYKPFIIPDLRSPSAATGVAWSPDGKYLATAGFTGTYVFGDLSAAIPSKQLTAPGAFSFAWDSNGKQIAVGGLDGVIYLEDVTASKLLSTIAVGKDAITALAWSPDGKRLATSGPDPVVRVWEVATSKELEEFPNQKEVGTESLAWSPYGARLVFGAMLTGNLTQTMNGLQMVVPSPSEEQLLTIMKRCAGASVQQRLESRLKQLPDFIDEVKKLTKDQMPPVCAADLIAVANALQQT